MTEKSRPTVYLICGFIGAGKTTFARELEARTGAVRVTKDEWLIRLIGNDATTPGFADVDSRITGLARDVAFDLARKGIDVILDEGFWAKEQRVEMRRRARDAGADVVIYYVDTPVEIMRARTVGRNTAMRTDSFLISAELWEGYLGYWQPPEDDEDVVLV